MLIYDRPKLQSLFTATADALDIPDHVYEDAILKYEDVGEHLGAEGSPLIRYSPEIYVQGSFRLGTVVRPINGSDEYDIDQVCRLTLKRQSVTQSDLKKKVGDRLKEREDLNRMLKESRRCWTLEYPQYPEMPGFHLDVLPAIQNEDRPPTGILLSDKELKLWQNSNPIAYAEWFKERMAVAFQKKATVLAESLAISIEEVPTWQVKTPLQRCVQILKRHRDIYFAKASDDKPVSIIITTLAAHAYQNEEDIFDALVSIVSGMSNFIENRNGTWWVENPVDTDENFADKWNEYPERHTAFKKWLDKVKQDFARVSRAASLREGVELLNESIGEETMDKVASNLGVPSRNHAPAVVQPTPVVPPLGDTSHALDPNGKFQIALVPNYKVRITGSVYIQQYGKRRWILSNRPVPKRVWLRFTVKTNVPEPYAVHWQVTNSGTEAMNANQLRGDFYLSEDVRKRVRWEFTEYQGTHWVKAFVINDSGICVAQSMKKFVKIR